MKKGLFLFFVSATVLCFPGCEETYDMDRLSKQAHLSPAIGIAAVKGDVSLADIVKEDDTVRYDDDNFVRLVFREDSVIEKSLEDFYDLTDLVSYTDTYKMGELAIAPFTGSLTWTLDQISQNFSPALRSQFLALNDGLNHPFPSFPLTNLGERTFPVFSNFEFAVFKSGFIDISVRNNLTAPLNSITVNLFNVTGSTPIGGTAVIPAIQPGQTQTVSIDLSDRTITNSIKAAVVLSGSPGTTTPVRIDLANSNIVVTLRGRDMKVKSGRVILPVQAVETLDKKDTIDFDPGDDVEIDEIRSIAGSFTYRVQSGVPLRAALDFTLPDALRSGVPLAESITILPNSIQYGSISVNNTVFDLTSDPDQPYNRLPLEYNLTVSSDGNMVNFSSEDEISLLLELSDPELDYARGWFGQQSEDIEADSIDLEIDEIINKISGEYFISSPSIKVNYRNSFAVPIEVTLAVNGRRGSENVNLGLVPFVLASPVAPGERDKEGTYVIDKTNSSLPSLVSLPPEVIKYSGSARMNPLTASNIRNNYVFGDSRFLASMEIEVPLEFRLNNLQFADTVENFMKSDGDDEDSQFGPGDFEYVRVELKADNGFPLGASVSMSLYDPVTATVKSTVDAADMLKPAPVGSDGRANGTTESATTISFTREFLSLVDTSDEIIFRFTLNTTDGATRNIKIYSDYRINFRAALIVKPDINLK